MAAFLRSILIIGLCSLNLSVLAAAAKKPAKPKPDPVAALDDFNKWPARDFANVTVIQCPIAVYIKDAEAKNNKDAERLEGAEFLGNEEIKVKLRAFTRVKIKNDGSNAKGWPDSWLKSTENGAMLVLFSSDKTKVFTYGKATAKKDFTKEALLAAIDTLVKYEAEKRAVAEAKAKEEADKIKTPAEEKAGLLDIGGTKKPADKEKPKPKPQDTPPENE